MTRLARLRLAVRAVLTAPRRIRRELPQLLVEPDVGAHRASPADAERTVRLAHRVLGRLDRLRRLSNDRWRVTCLYRSVTECTVLRELGFPARVVIGARAVENGVLDAHAWVECVGVPCASTRGDEPYEVLAPASIHL